MPKPNTCPKPLLLEADSCESSDVESPVIPMGDGNMINMEQYQPDSDSDSDDSAGSGYVTPNLFGSHEETELYYAYHGFNGQQSQPEVPPLIQLVLQELHRSGSTSSAAPSSTSTGASIANTNVPGFRQGMEVHSGMWH